MRETFFKKLKSLPNSSGVYIFYGKKKEVFYVGKATSLRDRVKSYFRADENPRIANRPIDYFINEIQDIEIKRTDSVLEAYILEQDLIKKLQPKYNAMGKDDKSFCYVAVTKENFPRILILRETELLKFPILKFSKKIQNAKYNMLYAKIYGPYTSRRQIEIALKILRKIFPYHARPAKTEKGCLDYQIGLCPGPYDGAISRADYQKNIHGIRMVLEGKKINLIKRMEKEMQAYAQKNKYEKAAQIRNKIFALKHVQDVALISHPYASTSPSSRGTSSRAGEGILRFEGYDISNISGQYAVGSMVVFDNSGGEFGPNKNEYRKFKVKTVSGANDIGMMREMLLRRFKNPWDQPELILLDGGKGHLNMGVKVLKNLGLIIPIMTVAKGADRKNLELRTFNFEPGNKIAFVLKNKILVKYIMDEAHRFAVGYHRNLRSKTF